MYEKIFKRLIDIVLSFTALIVLSPVILLLSLIGAIIMKGNPFFLQPRPGKKLKTGNEKIFKLIKFRTMSNKKDQSGNLLPDCYRITKYGSWLRSTSLDELPSLLNILFSDISFVGPRPFLVRDCVFMSYEQRKRHNVKPGLTGFAQVNGRNNISWEKKIEYDLYYINKGITFFGDMVIILKTIIKVFKRSDITRNGTVSDIDYGDWLLMNGKIDIDTYTRKLKEAEKKLKRGMM